MAPKTKPASVNEPPVAVFSSAANNLTVVFNASASHDPDGSIANYSWTFGDDSGSYGKDVTHTYAANGTYNATLIVTDNGGKNDSSSKNVTVEQMVTPVMNKQPVAVIEIVAVDNLTVSLSGAESSALQSKTITDYAWTFGDDSTGTGVSVSHTYAADGTYTITLNVTDSGGATNSATVGLKVSQEPAEENPPTAVIDLVVVTNLTVELSGFDSTAAPGATIVKYVWDFGDGTNGTGVNVTHMYASNGTYRITLTVTDSLGLSGKASIKVSVSSGPTPPPNPHPQGPPGLLHAIEIHKEKADRNGGLQNSLDHLEENLDRWLQTNGLAP